MSFKEYVSYDAMGLVELIRNKEVTADEVLQAAIDRCEEINPDINAVTCTMFEQAQQSIQTLSKDGPLFGVPFLLKDLSLAYAGVPTTQGSVFFKDYVPQHDSELVTRYKKAGLIIMGKSNTPEFGTSFITESKLLGACRNPFDLNRTPGGSSGGAAAAVAAGIVPVAHASDGGGSIRVPASCCGLIGLKPTRARVPVGPDRGESCSGLSVQHAITRSVRDSALLLDIAKGFELGDPYCAPPAPESYLQAMQQPLRPLKVGVITSAPDNVPVDDVCIAAVKHAITFCEHHGFIVEEAQWPKLSDQLGFATNTIWAANLADNCMKYVDATGRKFTKEDIEPANLTLIQMGRKLAARDYAHALHVMHSVGRLVANWFLYYDVILTPTLAKPPVKIGELVFDPAGCSANDFFRDKVMTFAPFTSLFNVTGQPAISLPLYKTKAGLPIGVQFAAPFGDELTLLQLANLFQGIEDIGVTKC